MRILDRYVLATFLKNYLMSFLVLVGLYVVMDMTFKFDEFVEIKAVGGASGVPGVISVVANIADYYFYQTFLFFTQLSPIIPGVAAAFTLMRFSRFNELVAFLAAGVPLLRVAMPIILAAVVLNALVVMDQELIIPNIIPKLARSSDEVGGGDSKTFPINMLRDKKGSRLSVRIYTPGDAPVMEFIDLIETADSRPIAHVRARRARWDARQEYWAIEDGWRVDNLMPEASGDAVEKPVATLVTTIKPVDVSLYRRSNTVDWLSTGQINQLLEGAHGSEAIDLQRVKHARFTSPLLNIVMMLLAIPAVLTREPGGLKAAALKCFVYQGLCMGLVFVTQNLAGLPPANWEAHWPALMAWLPILIFGPVSVVLLDKVKT